MMTPLFAIEVWSFEFLIAAALGLAAILAVLAVYIASKPSAFRIVRSATIPAPVEAVFLQLNDFHNWQAWSPWAKLDPNATETYEGAANGVGAKMSWNGNKKVGEGRMTIVESNPNQLVRIQLEFLRPMRCTNETIFSCEPGGSNTHITWSMTGKNNFVGKLFCLFFNMDKMVGRDFEKGLANLETVVRAKKSAA